MKYKFWLKQYYSFNLHKKVKKFKKSVKKSLTLKLVAEDNNLVKNRQEQCGL